MTLLFYHVLQPLTVLAGVTVGRRVNKEDIRHQCIPDKKCLSNIMIIGYGHQG
jgi:hypothetical protein